MKNTKAKLGAFCEVSGMTKKAIAEELGISTGSLANKLNGKTEFTFSEVSRLAALLGSSIEELKDDVISGEPNA